MKKKQCILVLLSVTVMALNLSCGTTLKQTKRSTTTPTKAQQRADTSRLPNLNCTGLAPGTKGKLVADAGFRPKPNGFSFPNYASDQYPAGNLTTHDAWKLFGEQACKLIKDGKCIPTTALKTWVDQMNEAMNIGHCEGMAFLSTWFFTSQEQLQTYRKSAAFELTPAQHALLRSIAYYWTMQTLEPVISEATGFQEKTPTEILNTLITAINTKSALYTLGIYGQSGGHAITPYAVEDVGNGVFWIHVYDNNYPCAYKYVEVDTKTNIWRYAAAAINPAEDATPWTGSTGTMDLTSFAIRQKPMVCPFCTEAARCQKESRLAVLLNGQGSSLLATNPAGQRVGLDKGQVINEIPGAKFFRLRGASPRQGDRGGVLMLPPAPTYTIDITGAAEADSEPAQVSVFRSCRVYAVNDLQLESEQRDRLTIAEDGKLQYTAGHDESPTVEIAATNPNGVDTLDTISGISLSEGASLNVAVDPETGGISLSNDDPDFNAFDLDVTTVDLNGATQNFSYDDVDPGVEGEAVLDVNSDGSVDLGIDENNDGTIDESNIAPDEQSSGADYGAEDEAAASDEGTDAADENATADDANANDNTGSSDSDSSDSDSSDSSSSDSGGE